jgi:hypothetical protein
MMNKSLVAMLVVVLAVAGCGKNKQADGAADAAATARAPVAAGADAVAAVLQSTGTPMAKLGFVVLTKPVIGVQSALRLDITSPDPAALLLVAEADGLDIDPASARASVAFVTGGTTVSHELKVTPQREGLAEVTVRLRSGEAESVETVYVIPVLVARTAAAGG